MKKRTVLLIALLYSMESFTMINPIKIHNKIFSINIPHDKITIQIQELGKQITRDYKNKKPIFVGILNGAFIFLADLMRAVDVECEVDFMQISSYGNNTESSGNVVITKDVSRDLNNRDIIIVEDIIETGNSMEFLLEHLKKLNPKSVRIATFLHKNIVPQRSFNIDYIAFEIAPEFVIGYGLDYAQLGRNLKDLYILS